MSPPGPGQVRVGAVTFRPNRAKADFRAGNYIVAPSREPAMCWPFCVAHEIRSQVKVVPVTRSGDLAESGSQAGRYRDVLDMGSLR